MNGRIVIVLWQNEMIVQKNVSLQFLLFDVQNHCPYQKIFYTEKSSEFLIISYLIRKSDGLFLLK